MVLSENRLAGKLCLTIKGEIDSGDHEVVMEILNRATVKKNTIIAILARSYNERYNILIN